MRLRRLPLILLLLLVAPLLLAACGGQTSGLPAQPGRYTLKDKSITFDGEKYAFYWADGAGNLHRANTKDVKLKLGEDQHLEVTANKEAILHLKQDEPVTVEGRDSQGDFGNFWYPFLIGSMLSRGGGPVIVNNNPAPQEYRDPAHRYPPTDRFDRGDTLAGNVASGRAAPPDYSRLPQTSGTIGGQQGGTGGGNAATNKADASAASSGQSGGTGGGSAALNKSGSFKSGSQGYAPKVESGQIKPISGRDGPLVGAGSGASKAPSVSRPSAPRISTGRRR
jgi:hypothetical protein